MANCCNYIMAKQVNMIYTFPVVDENLIGSEIGHYSNRKEVINYDLKVVMVYGWNFIIKHRRLCCLVGVMHVEVVVPKHRKDSAIHLVAKVAKAQVDSIDFSELHSDKVILLLKVY